MFLSMSSLIVEHNSLYFENLYFCPAPDQGITLFQSWKLRLILSSITSGNLLFLCKILAVCCFCAGFKFDKYIIPIMNKARRILFVAVCCFKLTSYD